MTTEPQTQRDYVIVGLSDDNAKVHLRVRDNTSTAIVLLDQQAALALAGEIQGWALQIRKPNI